MPPSSPKVRLPAFSRALRGALFGGAIGAAFLSVGALRAAVFLLGGGRFKELSTDDLKLAVFYVGGFAVGGALVGAMWPYRRSKAVGYLSFALAGMIVMTAIMGSGNAELAATDAVEWTIGLSLGAVFGCAFGHGLLK